MVDLFNRKVKVGDAVVIGKDFNKLSDYLVAGIVKEIKNTENGSIATIEVTYNGRWKYGEDTKCNSDKLRTITYKDVSRAHNNLIIINNEYKM